MTFSARGISRGAVGAAGIALLTASSFGGALSAQAASTIPAQHGVNIQSTSSTDFGSAAFLQTLQNLKADHTNGVFLIIPLAQSNVYSTDIHATSNTPTDAALVTAITEAHSLGLTVTLKPHLDPQDGQWRASIDPSDRTTWFTNYGLIMQHYATLAQANNVEQLIIGTELIDMASDTHNATNTANWTALIAKLRTLYRGKIGYAANWGPSGTPTDEKHQIMFWNKLDFAGVDAYYPLAKNASDPQTVANFVGQLEQTDLASFSSSVGIPVIVTEMGYRSASGIAVNPGDYTLGSGVDDTVQANAYQAAFSYLSTLTNVTGVYMWDWKSDPNAGGPSDTDYTPQGKPAETVMSTWFGGTGDATTGTSLSALQPLSASASLSSAAGIVNTPLMITSAASNAAPYAEANVIVDTEIYDQNGAKVFQTFADTQTLPASATTTFQNSWTPNATGTYTVKVGIFAANWSQSLAWNNSAATYTVTVAPASAPSNPLFSANGISASAAVGTIANLVATVGNGGGALANAIIDLELYDAAGKQVLQKFTNVANFATGVQQQFALTYVPNIAGVYRMTVGVFSSDWTKNYLWNNQAALLTVTSAVTAPVIATTTPPVVTVPPVATTTTATSTAPVATSTPVTVPVATSTPVTTPVATSTPPVVATTTTVVVPPVVTPPAPVSTGSITPGTGSTRAGVGIDFSGRNFGHEESVVITTSTGTLGQAHADGGGNFTTGSLGLPRTPGTYTITFTGQNSGITGSSVITVTP